MKMENISEDSSKRILSTDDLINPLTVMMFLALLIVFTILISNGIIFLLEKWYALPVTEAISALTANSTREIRDFIRLILFINHLFIFIIPSATVAIIFYRKKWLKFLQLNFNPPFQQSINSLLAALMIIAAFPLAQFLLRINQKIPLPEWLKSLDEATNAMLQNLLSVETSYELILNLVVIAVIPAFGEELLFRGVIQRNFEKWFRNPHAAVWIAALLFSAFHMQFEGFLPRILLGAMLGYLFYLAGSIWVPIITHFVYNSIQIIAIYLYANDLSSIDIEQIDQTPIGLTIFSIIFVFIIGYYYVQFNVTSEKMVT